MIKNKPYRAAIVGCGRIASDFDDDSLMKKSYGISSHAGGYIDNPDVELIAAADVSREKLEKFGARWEVDKLYQDYRQMLGTEKPDILSICTWNSTHLDILEAAAANQVKAVFCEKPISNSLANADRMLKVAQDNKLVLMVNHSRRWDDLYQDIKSLIDQKKLGDIQQVSCYYTAGIANTCSHLFDVLRLFFGDVASVAGWYKGDPALADPNIDGYLTFKSGVTATLQSLDVKSYTLFEFDIYGTTGRLRIKDNGFSLGFWRAAASQRYLGYRELETQDPLLKIAPKKIMRNAIKNIVDCLLNNRAPACSGEDGVKALEVICAFLRSASEQGQLVRFPLTDRQAIINSR